MIKPLLLACLAPLCAPLLAAGAACTAVSGDRTPAVVELYTSEGCDSCPPADQWLSRLTPGPRLIPLAFHVDYWDYLGWRDAYGKAAFSERQRAGVRRQGGKVSYTPQIVVDGQDLRGWFRNAAFETQVAKTQNRAARARLEITARREGNVLVLNAGGALLGAATAAQRSAAGLFLVITERNLHSQVAAGENKGATLRHDHVVRELAGPFPPDAEGQFLVSRRMGLETRWKMPDLGVTAFIQDRSTGEFLQAVSLAPCAG